jgi:hypothetical protein
MLVFYRNNYCSDNKKALRGVILNLLENLEYFI